MYFMKFRLGIALVALMLVTAGCGDDDDDQSPPTTGQIAVTTTTTGDDLDDSYQITVDGTDVGAIDANGQVIVPDQTPGDKQVGLDDVAFNCVVSGDNPQTVTVVAGASAQASFSVACAAPNQPPVANAGEDQTVVDDGSGAVDVTLDGSGSSDADGTITNYAWTEDDVLIAAGEMPRTAFTVGVHTVVLTVTDDDGATDTDEVMITVEAAPAPISFATDILPYFEAGMANCVQCHSGGTGILGVNLDSYANIMAGGDNGPLVVAGDSQDATAKLLPKVEEDHNNGPDDAAFAVTLASWIDEGALDN
jgi:hypothetical protein